MIGHLRLQYARPPRGLRRGWRWATVLAAVLVAGGMAAGWPRVRPWVEQQAYLGRQRRCMAYVAPPADTVAYEEVPAHREELLRTGRYRLPPMLWTNNPPQEAEWYPYATLAPAPWLTLGPGMSQHGVVFLHARTSQGGLERLLAVVPTADFERLPELGREQIGHRVSLTGLAYVPAGTQVGARIGRPVMSPSISIVLAPSQRLRLYTGAADLADPAHLTIRYDVDGELGTIDGRLLDQVRDAASRVGEGLELKVRDGPALVGRPHPPGVTVWPGMPRKMYEQLLQVYGYRAFPDPRDSLKGRRREQVEARGPVPATKE